MNDTYVNMACKQNNYKVIPPEEAKPHIGSNSPDIPDGMLSSFQ